MPTGVKICINCSLQTTHHGN